MRKQVLAVTIAVLLVLSVFSVLQFWQIKPARASDTLIDGYAGVVDNGFNLISSGGVSRGGQSFTMLSSDYKITSVNFTLLKSGSPNGTGYAYLYDHSGTYGTSSVPTGSALAQSEGIDISTIAGSYMLYELTFNASQQYTMTANAYYCITFGNAENWETSGSDYVGLGMRITSPTHSGNEVKYVSSAWGYDSGFDVSFYVYGILTTATAPIFTVQSPNTTTVSMACLFSSLINDDVEVDFGIFGTNNTGHWVNETAVDIAAVSGWLNVTKTLNDTIGNVVQFIWHANDTSNNWSNSTMQSLTITSGTYYLTINSLPVAVTYTINGTIAGASVTASSGSPSDIQTAVNTIVAAGGGTVYVPAGDFTFNPPAVQNGQGVTVPIGVNIIGAGIGLTILRESVDVAFDNSVKTYMFYLGWTADTSKTNRISGISFIGHVDSDVSDKVGIFFEGRKDFRVDHCAFQDFPSQGIYVRGSRGVIDHCTFDNPYHDLFPPKSDPNGQPWAVWGYGIIIIGGGGGGDWVIDISTILGVYDRWGDAHPAVYIEDNNFTRCRHAIASNTNGWYISRFNNFTTATPYGQVDVHGGPPGGRGMESYNNTFDLSDESYSFGQDAAFQLRGGGGVVFNNTIIWNPSYTDRSVFLVPETSPPYDIHDLYIWNNTARYINGTAVDFNSKIVNTEGAILNVDYFLRAPTLALDGFTYTPYIYPHPLATIANSGTTNSTVALVQGTYSVAVLSQVVSGGFTYNFTQWQDASTNATIIVNLTANTTITATYVDISVVMVTIIAPTNATYDTPNIYVNFNGTGGTIDKKWMNLKNGTSWVYGSNITYPNLETFSGLVNGTHYTGYFWVNNTDGTLGQATVMFSIQIPLQPPDYLISQSENVYATAGNSGSRLVETSTGDLYCVYFKLSGSYYQIYVGYSSDDGLTWTSTRISTLSGMDSYNQYFPYMTIDSNDYLYVVWEGESPSYSSYDQIWYCNYTSSWSTPERLSTGSGMNTAWQTASAITVDSNDYPHVVWFGAATGYSTTQIWYTNRTTSAWSTPLRISTATGMDTNTMKYPAIVVDTNNYLHVLFRGKATGYSYSEMWYTNRTTGTWATPIVISTYAGMDGADQISPALAISSNNVLYAGWHGNATGYTYTQIWIAKCDGTWETPVRISTYSGMDSYSQEDPTIAIDSNNHVHVMWQGKATGSTNYNKIWYANYYNAWSTPQCIAAVGQNQYPNVRWSKYPNFNIPTTRLDFIFTSGTTSPYNVTYSSLSITISSEVIQVTVNTWWYCWW